MKKKKKKGTKFMQEKVGILRHKIVPGVRAFASARAKYFIYYSIRTYLFLFYILTFQNAPH